MKLMKTMLALGVFALMGSLPVMTAQAEKGVKCDDQKQICRDRNGPSVEQTRQRYGDQAAQRLQKRLSKGEGAISRAAVEETVGRAAVEGTVADRAVVRAAVEETVAGRAAVSNNQEMFFHRWVACAVSVRSKPATNTISPTINLLRNTLGLGLRID